MIFGRAVGELHKKARETRNLADTGTHSSVYEECPGCWTWELFTRNDEITNIRSPVIEELRWAILGIW